ncbi:MAG: ABC transporter substrate-binding protein [Clostridia bacterium]|nr:ABC transporter substrate-binding protein [Clostridia bacterium]
MKKLTRTLAILLALVMVFSLVACKKATPEDGQPAATEASTPEKDPNTPLVVGYSPFSSKFSPFFAETAYDQDVASMTQISLLTTDRVGTVIYKGIDGETIPYNGTDYTYYGPADLEVTENADGTVFYDFTLRDDLVFSDGEPVTVDDIIFNMYVLCDPTYDGSSTLYSQPIEGMEEYRSGMDTLFNLIQAAGPDNTDFTLWTEEQQTAFFDAANKATVAMAQEIVDYCKAAGYNAEDDSVSACAANWGFEVPEDGTVEDFADILIEAYGGDYVEMFSVENAGSTLSDLMENYDEYTVGVKTGDSAPNITGIQKTGDNTLRIVATKVDASMIYQLGINIAPMHYYGDASLYDYDNNSFGFPKGDLSSVREKTTEPLGAGAYKFVKFENGVVSFEANETYYKGAPKTKYIQFREMQDKDKLNGVVTGTVDITDPSFSMEIEGQIKDANGGELNGPVITTSLVDNLGYGYIGINAVNVSVDGKPESDASKNLRKAFATIFSVYRDVAIDSYYGEFASVINYPISNTSWAAPQPADSDYRLAFSVDVNGEDIYTSDMNADAKYAAAKEAALGFLEAAGYKIENGKAVEAPKGAKLEYEAMIPADGTGDHPSFMILTLAKDALAEIGITLVVNDLSNSSDLWTALEANQGEIWCAAWGATIDPDMYQIYYSDAENGPIKQAGKNPNGGPAQGGSSYMYCITDAELDQMIMDARANTNQTYRKAMYKACLDTIIDWACEVPVYQRQNVIIFSTERVNVETVTPDITTFYGWMSEIENTELN